MYKKLNKQQLKNFLPIIEEKISSLPVKYNIEELNNSLSEIFKYYLLFTHWTEIVNNEISDMQMSDIFYNRYYWFMMYSRKYQSQNGLDEGIEQQAFKLLEEADHMDFDINWEIIENIEKLIDSEISE